MPVVARLLLVGAALISLPASLGAQGEAASEAILLQRLRTWFDARIDGTHSHGQYMRKGCTSTNGKTPGWGGFPVERCDYTHTLNEIEVSTTGYFLFPPGDMLSKWVLNACKDGKQADLTLCTGRLASKIWNASNAQFPVAGYVIEPAQEKKWKRSNEPYCYLFRNGVTVATLQHWKESQAHVENKCGTDDANAENVLRALKYARLSSTSREQYALALKMLKASKERDADELRRIGTEAANSPDWAAVAGEEFRRAWKSDRNALFLGTVLGGLSQCDGNVWEPGVALPESCKK
jgi:hypothetical protein